MKRDRKKKSGQSELRLIKRCAEFIPKEESAQFPRSVRGIYVLLKEIPKRKPRYNVLYVGLAKRSIRGRLKKHAAGKRRGKLWTHFSAFEVWDNIRDEEIVELEGILRHIYRKDSKANKINKQKRFEKLTKIRNNNLKEW